MYSQQTNDLQMLWHNQRIRTQMIQMKTTKLNSQARFWIVFESILTWIDELDYRFCVELLCWIPYIVICLCSTLFDADRMFLSFFDCTTVAVIALCLRLPHMLWWYNDYIIKHWNEIKGIASYSKLKPFFFFFFAIVTVHSQFNYQTHKYRFFRTFAKLFD